MYDFLLKFYELANGRMVNLFISLIAISLILQIVVLFKTRDIMRSEKSLKNIKSDLILIFFSL
ncbi:MAG: hypothetical protein LBV67_01175, partial [Streptococcaceae bacterium]|nr:hypothetical protein [Streptococcaceae bacterium]